MSDRDLEIRDVSIADFNLNARENREALAAIDRGLTMFNRTAQPDSEAAPLLLTISGKDGRTVGGAAGRTAYGWLRIDMVWIADELRGRGYGASLMGMAEEIARDRGCIGIHLDTHGFQAPGFYERLGYEVFGRLEDYPEGHTHFYFRKRIAPDGFREP